MCELKGSSEWASKAVCSLARLICLLLFACRATRLPLGLIKPTLERDVVHTSSELAHWATSLQSKFTREEADVAGAPVGSAHVFGRRRRRRQASPFARSKQYAGDLVVTQQAAISLARSPARNSSGRLACMRARALHHTHKHTRAHKWLEHARSSLGDKYAPLSHLAERHD